MYCRPHGSYAIDDDAIQRILDDASNPLARIARTIQSGHGVLDIGCGNGILSLLLKALHKDCLIDGIEPNAEAAELARKHYRRIYQQGLNEARHHVSNTYDHIVLADVVEHTFDPVQTLRVAASFLKQDGRLWISVPNVAFAPVRAELLNGKWQYTDWGIIERTHIRFFTLDSLIKTVRASSLSVLQTSCLCRSPFLMDKRLQDYCLDIQTLLRLRADPLSFTYQFLLECASESSQTQQDNDEAIAWVGLNQHIVREYIRLRRLAKKS
jgi:2-polyprenyl-3-methyl-5-hydroxy-6-metoxy-1,4-benzoquinol methylase